MGQQQINEAVRYHKITLITRPVWVAVPTLLYMPVRHWMFFHILKQTITNILPSTKDPHILVPHSQIDEKEIYPPVF